MEQSVDKQNIDESQIIMLTERRQIKVSTYYMTQFI